MARQVSLSKFLVSWLHISKNVENLALVMFKLIRTSIIKTTIEYFFHADWMYARGEYYLVLVLTNCHVSFKTHKYKLLKWFTQVWRKKYLKKKNSVFIRSHAVHRVSITFINCIDNRSNISYGFLVDASILRIVFFLEYFILVYPVFVLS